MDRPRRRGFWRDLWAALLSDPEQVILEVLHQHGECDGNQVYDLSEGRLFWGQQYRHLHALEEEGLITSRTVPRTSGDPWIDARYPMKFLYRLTGDGHRRLCREEMSTAEALGAEHG